MRRVSFARAFLEALGATEVRFGNIADDFVQGEVLYDPSDPKERQEFRWRITEEEVPGEDALQLLRLLRDEKLLSIDKLRVSRDELRERFQRASGRKISDSGFSNIVESVERIEIPMLDDGQERGDSFFIHE